MPAKLNEGLKDDGDVSDVSDRQIVMPGAHSFTWHGTGRSLLEAKLRAIDAACSSVRMETFTFRNSDIGGRFREALAAASS